MLQILGKATSINVRKVLWTCAELDLPFEREDWGTGFRSTETADFLALNPNAMAFLALARKSPAHQDAEAIRASSANWASHIGILNRQLESTGAFVAGPDFSLADIPIGLSLNRWFSTPLAHPDFPAVSDYFERLAAQPGYRDYCRNGTP